MFFSHSQAGILTSLLRKLAPFVALIAVVSCSGKKPASSGPRDIVVILLDAVRRENVSTYGYHRKTTPVIDAIAGDGVVFERAYSAAPWTLASVATLFTGNFPATHGAGVWADDRSTGSPTALPDHAVTLAGRLKEIGYKTYARSANPYLQLGCGQGFDITETIPGSANELVEWGLERANETGDAPMFLYLQFMDAHTSRDLSREFASMYPADTPGPRTPSHQLFDDWIEKQFRGDELASFAKHRVAVYDGAIHSMDRAVGKLMKGLEKRGRLDRTWIVILSDHGEEFWDHLDIQEKSYHDSRGYFGVGHGHTLFEELIQVPLIIKGPEVTAATRIKTPVSLVHIAPTLLNVAGLDGKLGNYTYGRPLTGTLAGAEPPREPVYSQQILYGHKRRCIIDEQDWKLIISFDAREKPLLFHLSDDPHEKNDVYAKEPERAAQLRARLTEFFDTLPRASSFDATPIDGSTADQLRNVGYLKNSNPPVASRPAGGKK